MQFKSRILSWCLLLLAPSAFGSAFLVEEFVNHLPEHIKTEYFVEAKDDFLFPIKDHGSGIPFGRHINEGEVGLARFNDKFVFIGSGYTKLMGTSKWVTENPRPNDPRFVPKSKVPMNQNLIEHGTWTIVRVAQGEIGYMQNTNEGKPMFLLPGSHQFNDASLKFVRFITFEDDEVQAGNFTFRKIHASQKGILDLNDGRLVMLEPGLHLIKSPNRLKAVVSMRQEQIVLDKKLYYTEDDVGLKVVGVLYYTIADPLLAFNKAFDSEADIVKTLREQAIATLTNVIRCQQFANIGRDNDENKNKTMQEQIDYRKFLTSTTQTFHDLFQDKFGTPNGISIESLSITDFNFESQEMQDNITQNAILYAKSKAELENLAAQTRIAQAQAEKDREVKNISAQSDLDVVRRNAEAKRISFESEAEEISILAKAKADAIRQEADAEAYRLETIAIAKAKFAQLVGQTAFGQQLVLTELQAKALSNTQFILAERIPEFLKIGAFGPGQNAGEGEQESAAARRILERRATQTAQEVGQTEI